MKEKVGTSDIKMRESRKDELDEQNCNESKSDACDKDLNWERAGKDRMVVEIRVCRVTAGTWQGRLRFCDMNVCG